MWKRQAKAAHELTRLVVDAFSGEKPFLRLLLLPTLQLACVRALFIMGPREKLPAPTLDSCPTKGSSEDETTCCFLEGHPSSGACI